MTDKERQRRSRQRGIRGNNRDSDRETGNVKLWLVSTKGLLLFSRLI